MSAEQKIEGVPDGWKFLGFRSGVKYPEWILNSHGRPEQWPEWQGPSGGVCAVLERIPKRQMLIAEAEVPPDFRIEGGGAIVAYRSGMGISLDVHRFNAEVFRIEERDA